MDHSLAYLEKMWLYMVREGGVVGPEKHGRMPDRITYIDYYGGGLNIDRGLTRKAIESLEYGGIDYRNCGPVRDGYGSVFVGSFVGPGTYNYFYGTLCTADGKKWDWATPSIEFNFPKVVELLCDPTLNLQGAINSLKERMDGSW